MILIKENGINNAFYYLQSRVRGREKRCLVHGPLRWQKQLLQCYTRKEKGNENVQYNSNITE